MGKSIEKRGILFVMGLSLIVFLPAFFAKFVLFDDDLHIFRNGNLALPFFDGLKTFWTESYRGFYIPITYTVWSVLTLLTRHLTEIKTLEQLSPLSFHVSNVLIHLTNTYLVWSIIRRFFSNPLAVLGGVILFAIHPIQVETVSWATGMKDLLCTFFLLVGFSLALEYFSRKSVWSLWLATVFFLFALLSKPSAIVLPLAVPLILFLFKREWAQKSLTISCFWLFLAIPFAYITSTLQPQSLLLDYTPVYLRPIVALDSIAFYLKKLLLPFEFIPDYSRTPKAILESKVTYFEIAALLTLVGYFAYRRWWQVLAFLAVTVTLLCPVLGFVPFSFQNFSTVADHYFYFPMLGVALFATLLLTKIEFQPRILLGYALCLAVISFIQVLRWTETKKLFQYALSVNPLSVIAHNNLAVQYETEGDLETSLYHYQQASRINPRLNHHHYNVGNALLKMGRIQEAFMAFEETLIVDPKYPEAYFSLGLIEESNQNDEKAGALFQTALDLDPGMGKAGIKLGANLAKRGRYAEGIRKIQEAIDLDPRAAGQGYFHLGRAYLKKKDYERAKEAFHKSLLIIPEHKGALEELAKLP